MFGSSVFFAEKAYLFILSLGIELSVLILFFLLFLFFLFL